MAKTNITVCLRAAASDSLEDAVAEAIAPFEADGSRGWELDVWDSWQICGGSPREGGFPVLPGHEDDVRLIHELPNRWLPEQEVAPSEFGWCAGGPRELLDFSATPDEARQLAADAWSTWRELTAEFPQARPWQVFQDRTEPALESCSHEELVAAYRGQPLVSAFDAYLATHARRPYSSWFLAFVDPVREVGQTELAAFVDRQSGLALRSRNVLTLGGWWYEDGEPGIHGACQSPAQCPHQPELPPGQEHIQRYLAGLPAGTLLVNVRCHV
ncbi:hypothetical protein ACIBKX_07545 [Streptomyces sp. NPDC050658]|uniref:hypothetical protein n=1 Tax=unclassified Streptomyces TaxID=2593676 RepID=UPI0034282638